MEQQREVVDAEVGKLTVSPRVATGKGVARKLRAKGLVPGVLYGAKEEPQMLTVDPKALHRALDPAKKQNTLIALSIVAEGKSPTEKQVMVKDYQVDALDHTLLHVDFINVSSSELVDAEVPLQLEGKPEGLKYGGVLNQVYRTLHVRCTPDKIPSLVTLDVSALEIGQSLSVSEIPVPDGVTFALPAEQTVALVVAPRGASADEEAASEEGEEGAEGEAAAAGDAKPEEGAKKD